MDLIDVLREEARSTSRATKAMSAAKSARNQAASDEGACYAGLEPEQTTSWGAADEIARLRAEITVLRSHPRMTRCDNCGSLVNLDKA